MSGLSGRVFNYSAGPATLPVSVLEKVQGELLNFHNTGMSVMEMSHRSKEFKGIIIEAEQLLRELMGIPDRYKVFFIQGGASLQFSMVPLNLLPRNETATYIHTGTWSKKAMQEASKQGTVQVIKSPTANSIPHVTQQDIHQHSHYVHITHNNTIEGTRYSELPETGSIPIVSDMSSSILSERIHVADYGLIYAGAQKNLGPAGVTIVIADEGLIGKQSEDCPTMLAYQTYSSSDSLYNTPPTFSIYVVKLMLQWMKEQGGISTIADANYEKASLFYKYIDESSLYHNRVDSNSRSFMNIPFTTDSEELDTLFIKKAAETGLVNLKGHRSVGGMRASFYNAMPIDGVTSLIDFMKEFEGTVRREAHA